MRTRTRTLPYTRVRPTLTHTQGGLRARAHKHTHAELHTGTHTELHRERERAHTGTHTLSFARRNRQELARARTSGAHTHARTHARAPRKRCSSWSRSLELCSVRSSSEPKGFFSLQLWVGGAKSVENVVCLPKFGTDKCQMTPERLHLCRQVGIAKPSVLGAIGAIEEREKSTFSDGLLFSR